VTTHMFSKFKPCLKLLHGVDNSLKALAASLPTRRLMNKVELPNSMECITNHINTKRANLPSTLYATYDWPFMINHVEPPSTDPAG
jgi:hypothetical protein